MAGEQSCFSFFSLESFQRQFLKFMNMTKTVFTVGHTIPNFEMETYNAAEGQFEKISLEKFKSQGKWSVLFFYPADFTFVCPTELADLADKEAALKEMNIEVVSVSCDTKYAHLAWRNSEKLLQNVKYQMAADPTGTVARLFGVYDDATGLALRGTFIIDPDGKLVSSEVNYYNLGRDVAELARKLEAFVYLREHPEEACPAKWKRGSKTLTPSEKLVGQVYDALQ
jgi:peroxiredoxin (alkyl hydroperoxide reductase subunit C)